MPAPSGVCATHTRTPAIHSYGPTHRAERVQATQGAKPQIRVVCKRNETLVPTTNRMKKHTRKGSDEPRDKALRSLIIIGNAHRRRAHYTSDNAYLLVLPRPPPQSEARHTSHMHDVAWLHLIPSCPCTNPSSFRQVAMRPFSSRPVLWCPGSRQVSSLFGLVASIPSLFGQCLEAARSARNCSGSLKPGESSTLGGCWRCCGFTRRAPQHLLELGELHHPALVRIILVEEVVDGLDR